MRSEGLVKQAERVKDYMNYMITYEMEEMIQRWTRCCSTFPLWLRVQEAFDPLKGRAVSQFVHVEDLLFLRCD